MGIHTLGSALKLLIVSTSRVEPVPSAVCGFTAVAGLILART